MTVPENIIPKKFKIKVGPRGVRIESRKESDEKSNIKLPLQRRPDTIQEVQKEKRRKTDQSIKQQCDIILKELMSHKNGWAFNHPVDPIAYGIPDYFKIIKKPMDLGTIKSKLSNNLYIQAEEFASDIRLVFSNCMTYNPPHNEFHTMAKELNGIFNRRWNLDGEKLNEESKSNEGGILQKCGKICPKMQFEEKQKLRIKMKEMLSGKMNEKLQNILKKFNLNNLKEWIDLDINAIDDEILWEFKAMLKSSLCLSSSKVEPVKATKPIEKPIQKKVLDKGVDRVSQNLTKAKPPMGCSVNSTCVSCGRLSCLCSKNTKNSKNSSSNDSQCGVNAKISTDSNQGLTPLVDLQLSPQKALRVAMLKSRFAGTILKATHQGDEVDPVKLKEEKEKLEKQQRQEKLRIEAQIIASEAASRLKVEAEAKKKRQMDREAARIALQQMEKTVEIDENLRIIKEVEMLSRNSMAEASLERLGLYIKDDFFDDDDEEEGEFMGCNNRSIL